LSYTKITNPSNPKIKQTLDIKNKRGKYKADAFIIEGPHLIEMALTSGHEIKEVFFTNAFASKKDGQKLLRQLAKNVTVIPAKLVPAGLRQEAGIQRPSMQKRKTTSELDSRRSLPSKSVIGGGNNKMKIEIFEVTEHIINKLTDTDTPQGIIAIVSYKSQNLEEIIFKSIPLIVVINGVQEPGNLGTIIRTSDAAGADAVIILPGTCDVFMQKTLRATAGSIFNIPIVYAETDELLRWLRANSIQLIATALDLDKSIFDSDLKKPLALVFGNEAHGVSNVIKKNADLVLKIPIFGKAESLNVAISAAVCLFEAVRQRVQLSTLNF
jgi:TrmH family RNA methyltransferase